MTGARPEAVFVFEFAFEDVGDDLHVAMRMCGEAVIGRDPIFVDDAQRTESHPFWIPVIVEAEGVMALQPALISAAAFVAFSDLNHAVLSLC